MTVAAEDRLFIFATIRPKPGHVDDVLGALEDLIPPTLAEPGCHLFSVFRNREDPGVVHLYESFDDDAALNLHYAADYTKHIFKQYEDWLEAPVQVTRLKAASTKSSAQYG